MNTKGKGIPYTLSLRSPDGGVDSRERVCAWTYGASPGPGSLFTTVPHRCYGPHPILSPSKVLRTRNLGRNSNPNRRTPWTCSVRGRDPESKGETLDSPMKSNGPFQEDRKGNLFCLSE